MLLSCGVIMLELCRHIACLNDLFIICKCLFYTGGEAGSGV